MANVVNYDIISVTVRMARMSQTQCRSNPLLTVMNIFKGTRMSFLPD